jgi:Flp pilus assembly protein TadG
VLMNHSSRTFGRAERGALGILLALLIPLLLGLSALVIDIGRMLVVRSELQSAADSCALAAVSAIPAGGSDQASLQRAEALGLAPADALATSLSGQARPATSVNRFDFQSRELGLDAIQVQFSTSQTGPWLAADSGGFNVSAPARFVRCTARPQTVNLLLAGLVGSWTQMSASATAVAGLVPSQVSCAFPVGLCKEAGTGAQSSPPFGLVAGRWYSEPDSSGTKRYGPGTFGWVDFSPPSGGGDELAKSIEGRGVCSLATGGLVGESGVKSSVYDSWNSRFGLYRSGGPTASQSPGDLSGFAYTSKSWPKGSEAYSGRPVSGNSNFLTSRMTFTPYQGNNAAGVNANFTTNWSAAERQAKGRDRRLVVSPVIDCSIWNDNGSARPTIEAWGCALLLSPIGSGGSKQGPGAIEYLGLAGAIGSPCASSGLPGGSSSGGPRVPALLE